MTNTSPQSSLCIFLWHWFWYKISQCYGNKSASDTYVEFRYCCYATSPRPLPFAYSCCFPIIPTRHAHRSTHLSSKRHTTHQPRPQIDGVISDLLPLAHRSQNQTKRLFTTKKVLYPPLSFCFYTTFVYLLSSSHNKVTQHEKWLSNLQVVLYHS